MRLEQDPDEVFASGCHHILGLGMFLELYDRMEESAFRHGLRNLFVMSAEDEPGWYGQGTCAGIDAGLCHLSAAFSVWMPPEQRDIAAEIIDRRYFGAPP